MKKFIYFLIALLLIVPAIVFVTNKNGKEIKYSANTSTSTKMIKTTYFIDRSTKKKEEEEAKKKAEEEAAEEARKKEIERLEKIEEEKKKKAAAATKVQEEEEVVSSRQEASASSDSVGETKTVTTNSDKRVFEDVNGSGSAKFYDRKMSSYGTDCCASRAYKARRVEQGLSEFPSEQEIIEKTLAGVGLGITASGYQFKYRDIWFNAGSYGMVRMVAADHYGQYDFPLGTIVKIKDNNTGEEYKAIVIDRGDPNIGLDSKYIFDLVSENTLAAKYYGIHKNIDVEVVHVGTLTDRRNIRRYGHL